jgi:hypothetical protein
VEKLVGVLIGIVLVVPAGAEATPGAAGLLGSAARLSGLKARHPVATARVSAARYDRLLQLARNRDYPPALRDVDSRLYERLGLTTWSATASSASRAWYDLRARKLVLRASPSAGRTRVVYELVRALIDQNFGLRRMLGLRARDRDRALAAAAIVDGTAALASGLRADPLRGTALDRFLQLDYSAGVGPGRALAAQLRYLGGRRALASALRTFPQTTEQLLHVDKFLERERALPVKLVEEVGDLRLSGAQTFGELDVRNLLRAFDIADAVQAGDGWGGGRLAAYVKPSGETVAALVLRWDSPEDAEQWRAITPAYVQAAFPGATVSECPPLDGCWSASSEIAVTTIDRTSVIVSGPGAAGLAAALSNPQLQP